MTENELLAKVLADSVLEPKQKPHYEASLRLQSPLIPNKNNPDYDVVEKSNQELCERNAERAERG